MFCKKCGKQLEDDWKQCPYCGYPVNGNLVNSQSKKPVYKKWWFWVVLVIAVFFILGIIGSSVEESGEAQTIEKTEQKTKKEESEKEKVDFSKEDFQNIVGMKEEELKKQGLKKGEGDLGYVALNGNIQVFCTDGVVNKIVLSGDEEKTPAFYGSRLGMAEAEAYKKIAESYPEEGSAAEGKKFLNLETKASVNCKATEGKITEILYQVLSDEEVAEYQKQKEEALRAEYIFPDSDKKYLSEDEVRSIPVDKLYIGRNEIFARHGYIFEDENLKNHFEATSWYQGTIASADFQSSSVFNDFETKNVELIKRIEDEINGPSQEELDKQAAIDEAYNFILGKTFHMIDTQIQIQFTTENEVVAIGYYGSAPLTDKYCTYSVSSRYEVFKDNIYEYLTFITIDGVEYYMRYFSNGTMDLTGDGEFEGWYEIV